MCIWQPETITIPQQSFTQTAVFLPVMNGLERMLLLCSTCLSGYSEPKRWNKLIVAPIWMKDRFVRLIEREAEHAKKGLPAQIRGKDEFSV